MRTVSMRGMAPPSGTPRSLAGSLTIRVPCKRQGRKQFFFEKKNQKTFVRLVDAPDTKGTHQIE
jgi:hypothetical protein